MLNDLGPIKLTGPRALRVANAILEHYGAILWAVTALTIAYLILLPPCGDLLIAFRWADLEALQGHKP